VIFPRENIQLHEYIADEVSKYSPSFSTTFIFEVIGFVIALIFLKEKGIPALRSKLTS